MGVVVGQHEVGCAILLDDLPLSWIVVYGDDRVRVAQAGALQDVQSCAAAAIHSQAVARADSLPAMKTLAPRMRASRVVLNV